MNPDTPPTTPVGPTLSTPDPVVSSPAQAGPPPLNQRRLALVLAAGATLIIIIIAVVVSQSFGSKKTASTSPGGTIASVAPTPSLTPTPLPSNPALAPAASPSIDNIDGLTSDAGYTAKQLQDLEYALGKFAQKISLPNADISINETSISVTAANATNPNAVGLTVAFTVVVNDATTYNVSTFLSSPTAVATTITNSAGATLYSSGTVDLYNGIGDN